MAFAYVTPHGVLWGHQGLKLLLLPPRRQEASAVAHTGRPAPKKAQTPVGAPAKKSSIPSIAPQLWPAAWRNRLQLTKKGKICWTYARLGEDLGALRAGASADGRRARGDFLRKLFRELALPPGSHTFWPLWLEAEPQPDIFWNAMRELGCRGVVVFGSAAAKPLVPDARLEPLTQHVLAGRFVWVLRDIDVLLARDDHYRAALAFLQSRLKAFCHHRETG